MSVEFFFFFSFVLRQEEPPEVQSGRKRNLHVRPPIQNTKIFQVKPLITLIKISLKRPPLINDRLFLTTCERPLDVWSGLYFMTTPLVECEERLVTNQPSSQGPLLLSPRPQARTPGNRVECAFFVSIKLRVPNSFLQSGNPDPKFRVFPQSRGLFLASHLPRLRSIPNPEFQIRKIPNPDLQKREIPDPEKTIGDPLNSAHVK